MIVVVVVGFLENAKAFFENALGSPKTPFGGHVTVLPLFIAIVMAIIILGIVGLSNSRFQLQRDELALLLIRSLQLVRDERQHWLQHSALLHLPWNL